MQCLHNRPSCYDECDEYLESGSPAVMISNKSDIIGVNDWHLLVFLLCLLLCFFLSFFLSVLMLVSGCRHLFYLPISCVAVPFPSFLLPLPLCFSEEEAVCQSLSRDVVY